LLARIQDSKELPMADSSGMTVRHAWGEKTPLPTSMHHCMICLMEAEVVLWAGRKIIIVEREF
jgi:hypothetical protein